jgi:hypothetical protein
MTKRPLGQPDVLTAWWGRLAHRMLVEEWKQQEGTGPWVRQSTRAT